MPIVVQKYGGSSVADVEKLKAVAKRVVETKRAGFDVVVVVSAMGKTTDELLRLAKEVSTKPHKRELDMLLTSGERISMSLLTMAICDLGEQAISFTGSQSGIITNDSHTNARIIDVRPVRILDELAKGRIVIVAGYQGMSYKREVTTLGRGGSDTTAVALAAALGAELCEICSDIDGVYTADPRLLKNAKPIKELSYEEMLALAEGGAKVLNPEAVAYAQKHGVKIFATATFGKKGSGTYILKKAERKEYGEVVGIAHRSIVHLVRYFDGFNGVERLLSLVDEFGLPFYNIEIRRQENGEFFLRGVIPPEDAIGFEEFTKAASKLSGRLEVPEGIASITLVGEGITDSTKLSMKVWNALEKIGCPPFDLRTASGKITLLVPSEKVNKAVEKLHTDFINGKNL